MVFLVPPSPGRLIVLLAPRVGQFATMEFAATEFTVKICPTGISRMRQEANPATAAVDRTACQTRMLAQNGIQRQLILTNKRIGAVVQMPLFGIREEFPDGYDKNARFSARILKVFCMSPSYSLDANASRGRAGIFCGSAHTTVQPAEQRIHPTTAFFLHSLAQPATFHQAPQTRYWERKTGPQHSGFQDERQLLLFQVVAPFSRATLGQEN